MKKIIIANWKMNPLTESETVKLARAEDFSKVVIVPPFVFLPVVKKVVRKARLGAQDLFWKNPPAGGGAYTGEVSAGQLKSLGVKYVIVGHSERRASGETDVLVNKKIKAALINGFKTVLCVGEPWSVRRKGISAAKNFVKKQLKKNLEGTKNYKLKNKNLIIAYEPVWAIGTGRADKPANTIEMIKFIKEFLKTKNYKLKTKVLYGGSVTAKNVKAFLRNKEIDGALVGGASLKPVEFRKINDAVR